MARIHDYAQPSTPAASFEIILAMAAGTDARPVTLARHLRDQGLSRPCPRRATLWMEGSRYEWSGCRY